jgi:hypothetical protein
MLGGYDFQLHLGCYGPPMAKEIAKWHEFHLHLNYLGLPMAQEGKLEIIHIFTLVLCVFEDS